MKTKLKISALCLLILGLFSTTVTAADALLGAGATFPYPLYSKMFSEYNKQAGVKINYQAIGSGGGIRQVKNKTVDFGASDAYITDKEMELLKDPLVHVPICLGAVAISYNLPGVPTLNLTSEVLVGIFTGKIRKWNNLQIAKANPDISLPKLPITVVKRSDGSGTTFIFTDYLSKVDRRWEARIGRGKAVRWPVGLGGKGNAGVAGLVKNTPGSIGYIEMVYALQNKMNIARIKNKSGKFIKPSVKATSLAAAVEIPADTRVSLTNTEAKYGYPISGFTWILLHQDQAFKNRSLEEARQTLELIWWMTHEGQIYADKMDYAPLSLEAQRAAENILKKVTYNGKFVLK